jgi:hypothetical protein
MNKTRTLFVACSILLAISFARNVGASDFVIALKDESFKIQSFPFRVVAVWDVSTAKPYVGFVQTGMANRRTPAVLEGGTEKAIGALLDRSLPQIKDAREIVVKINQLVVYEATYASREVATVEANIAFLAKNGDGYVELFESAATYESSGLEVTKKHRANIAKAIGMCCDNFMMRYNKGLNRPQNLSADSARMNLSGFGDYPVLQETLAPKGVFRTFIDFRDNTPDMDSKFDFVPDIKTDKRHQADHAKVQWLHGEPPDDSVWGILHDGHVWMRLGKRFHKLISNKNELVLYAPAPKQSSGVIIGAFFGGLTGVGIALLIEHSFSNGDGVYKGEIVPYKLDLGTGMVIPQGGSSRRRVEARTIFYASSFNRENIVLSIDGKVNCDLDPDSFYRFRSGPDLPECEICIAKDASKKCIKLKPELLTTSVYLVRVKKGEPDFDVLDGEHRSSVLRKIREKEIKAMCVEE